MTDQRIIWHHDKKRQFQRIFSRHRLPSPIVNVAPVTHHTMPLEGGIHPIGSPWRFADVFGKA